MGSSTSTSRGSLAPLRPFRQDYSYSTNYSYSTEYRNVTNHVDKDVKFLISLIEKIIEIYTISNFHEDLHKIPISGSSFLKSFITETIGSINTRELCYIFLQKLCYILTMLKDCEAKGDQGLYCFYMSLDIPNAEFYLKNYNLDIIPKEDLSIRPPEKQKVIEECCICFIENEQTFLPCYHKVCNECYTKINKCPICRTEFVQHGFVQHGVVKPKKSDSNSLKMVELRQLASLQIAKIVKTVLELPNFVEL